MVVTIENVVNCPPLLSQWEHPQLPRHGCHSEESILNCHAMVVVVRTSSSTATVVMARRASSIATPWLSRRGEHPQLPHHCCYGEFSNRGYQDEESILNCHTLKNSIWRSRRFREQPGIHNVYLKLMYLHLYLSKHLIGVKMLLLTHTVHSNK